MPGPKLTAQTKSLLTVTQAAKILKVSPDTLRNWERSGKLVPERTAGGARRYQLSLIQELVAEKAPEVTPKKKGMLSISKAAKELGVSSDTLRNWERKGQISAERTDGGARRYSKSQLTFLKRELGLDRKQPQSNNPIVINDNGDTISLSASGYENEANPSEKTLVNVYEQTKAFRHSSFNIFRLALPLLILFLLAVPMAFLGFNNSNTQDNKVEKKLYDLASNVERLQNSLFNIASESGDLKSLPKSSQDVLAVSSIANLGKYLEINADVAFGGSIAVEGEGIFNENITAPNIVYGLIAGANVTITGDSQNPVISANQALSIETLATVTERGPSTTIPVELLGGVVIGDLLTIAQLTDDPGQAENGSMYYNTSDNKYRCYIDGEWEDCDTDTITEASGDIEGVTAGSGLTGGGDSGEVSLEIALTSSGASVITSSNSGLEVSSDGLSIIRGCGNGELLKWSSVSEEWQCGTDVGGLSSAVVDIREGGTPVGTNVTTLNFSAADFAISESPSGTDNFSIDYVNSGITRRAQNETISGNWTFSSGTPLSLTSLSPSISIANTGVLTITDGTNTLLSLSDNGTAGTLNVNTLSANTISGFTLAGNVVGSGSPTLSGLGTVNGTTLSGGTISGGTYAATGAIVVGNFTTTIGAGGTFNVSDGTNTLFTVTDAGTVGDLSNIGTISTSGAITQAGQTLDNTYVNVNESPAAGDISGSFQAGLSIAANSVALGTDTTGDYVATISGGNGLTGSGTGEGSTPTLAVGAGVGITVNADDIEVNEAFNFTFTGNLNITPSGTNDFTFTADADTNLILANLPTGTPTDALCLDASENVITCTSGGGSGTVTQIDTGNGLTGGPITTTGTIALGDLIANWDQNGAFDIVLDNASSELRVLESTGGTFYGIFDAGNLSADATLRLDSSINLSGGGNTLTLTGSASLNQDLLTTSLVTFDTLTLTNALSVANGGTGAQTLTGILIGNGTSAVTGTTASSGIAGAISDETGSGSLVFATSPTLVTPTLGVATATSINGLTLTANADGFAVAGGTTPRTLTITGANVTLNQSLQTSDSPTFAGATISGLGTNSAVYTNGSSALTTTAPTSGTIGYWSRTGTTLSPATANDNISIATTNTTGADLAITNTGVYTGTGLVNITANSATTGDIMRISATGLTTGTALTINGATGTGMTDAAFKVSGNIGHMNSLNGLVSSTATFTGGASTVGVNGYFETVTNPSAAASSYGLYSKVTDASSFSNVVVGSFNEVSSSANVAKGLYGTFNSVTTNSTAADTTIAYNGTAYIASGAVMTTGTRNTISYYAAPGSTAASTGGTTNIQGYRYGTNGTLAVGAGGTINFAAFYAGNATMNTTGTSTKIGLQFEDYATNLADNNYAICFDCDGTYSNASAINGLTWGSDANSVNLYRSANDTLRTNDAFSVNGTAVISSAGAISGLTGFSQLAGTFTLTPDSTNDVNITVANASGRYLNVAGLAGGTASNSLCIDGSSNVITCAGGGVGSGTITAVGSMTSGAAFADATADDDWLGLGASAGRIEFDDQTTDEVNILDANVGIGDASPTSLLTVGSGDLFQVNSSGNVIFNQTTPTVTFGNTGSMTFTDGANDLISFVDDQVDEGKITLFGNNGGVKSAIVEYEDGGVGDGYLRFTAGGTNGIIAEFRDCCNPLFQVRATNTKSYFTYGLAMDEALNVDWIDQSLSAHYLRLQNQYPTTTQTTALTGAIVDLATNWSVPNSSAGNQTGIAVTMANGGASATSIGISIGGAYDDGINFTGTPGTNLINSATLDITAAGGITGATNYSQLAGAFTLTPDGTNDVNITIANGSGRYLNITGLAGGTASNSLCVDASNNVITCTGGGVGGGTITAVGSMTSGDTFADSSADDDWLGLGASAGRIEFDDQTVDEVNILDASVGIGTATPAVKLDIVDGNDGSGGAIFAKDGGITVMSANGTYPLQVGNNTSAANSVRFRVDVNGAIDYSNVASTPTLTTFNATQNFNILTGNIKVGNGTPGLTLDGEDAYIEGTFEVDGAANFGGSVTVTGLSTTSAVYTDGSSALTTTAPTSGTIGYWSRTGTTLSPATSGDAITTSGNISTSGTGTLTAAGATNLNGTVALGDATGDTITFGGYVGSSIIPSTDDTYDLGDNTHRWKDLFLGGETLHIGTSTTDEGVLSYTTSSNTLLLDNVGTGGAMNFGNVTTNPTYAFLGSGTFSTSTGANSLNGDTTVANTKNFVAGQTTGKIGFGGSVSGSDYLIDMTLDNTQDWARGLNITQSNNANENSDVISITNTVNVGATTSRIIKNVNLSLTPTASLANSSMTVAGIDNALNLSSLTLGDSSSQTTSQTTYGDRVAITGTPIINNTDATGGSALQTIYATSSTLSLTPTLTAATSVSASYIGGYFTADVTSSGSASYNATVYGINAQSTGNLTTTGATTHYAGYFTTTGTADNNYGLYVQSVASGTNNYGLYLNSVASASTNYALYSAAAAQSYFAGNVGIGDSSPASLFTVGNGDDFQIDTNGTIAAATGITSSGTISFSGLSTNGVVYTTGGTGTLASEANLAVTRGGTGAGTVGSAGSIVYSNGSVYSFSAVGSSGECFTSNGSSAPSWTSCTTATNSPFTSSGGIISKLTSTDKLNITASEAADYSALFDTSIANTVDLVQISNNGFATVTDGVDGLGITFANGDGTTNSNAALRIAAVSGGGAGDGLQGIRIDGITAGAATENAIRIGANWDNYLDTDSIDISGAGAITGATGVSSSGTIAFSGLSTNGVVYTTGGTGTLASEANLAVTRGGTNAGTVGSAGSVAYSTGTAYAFSGVGSGGDCLISGGTGSPTWGNCTTINADSLDYDDFEDTLDYDADLITNQGAFTSVQNFTGTTTNGLTYNADSLTTGTALDLSVDALTTGKGLNITSTAPLLTSADLFNAASTGTYTIAQTVTGSVAEVSRSLTINAGATTLSVTGPVARISDNCTVSAGTCTSTASVMEVIQNYTSNSGSALLVSSAGNSSGFVFRANDDGTTTDSTPFLIDNTGNVGIGANSSNAKLYISQTGSDTPGSGQFIMLNTRYGFRESADSLSMHLDWFNGSWQATPLMTFNRSSGTVGFNDATPDAIVDIDSAITSSNIFGITQTGSFTGTGTSSVAQITSGATSGDIMTISASALTSGSALVLSGSSTGATDALFKVVGTLGAMGTSNGQINSTATISTSTSSQAINAYFNTINANTSAANNAYGVYSNLTDNTTLANSILGIQSSVSSTNNAAKVLYGMIGLTSSTSTTADTQYALFSGTTASGVITTGSRSVVGVRANATSSSASTGGNTNVFGVLAQANGNVSTGATISNFGVYVANGAYDAGGSSNSYGLFMENITGADTNYAIWSAGGKSYHAGDFGIGMDPGTVNLAVLGTNGVDGFRVYSNNQARYATVYAEPAGTIYFQSDTTYCQLPVSSTSFTCPSDSRLKKNISNIDNGLEAINQLRPTTFDMISGGTNTQAGFIAQEVQEVLPDAIYPGQNGMLTLSMDHIVPYTVKAVQELDQKLENALLTIGEDGFADKEFAAKKLSITADANIAGTITAGNYAIDASKLNQTGSLASVPVVANKSSIADAVNALNEAQKNQENRIASVESQTASQSAQLADQAVRQASLQVNLENTQNMTADLETKVTEQKSALELFREQIEAQISNLNGDGESSSDAASDPVLTAPDELIASESGAVAEFTANVISGNAATISESLSSLGETNLANTFIAGDLTVDGTLSITNGNEINVIGAADCHSVESQNPGIGTCAVGVLYLQKSPLASAVNFFDGLFTLDKTGSFKAPSVTVAEFKVVANKISGAATIKKGETRVVIDNPLVAQNARILLTPTTSSNAILAVTKKTDGESFTVSSIYSSSEDITFDWWLIQEVEESVPVSE